MDTDDLRDAIGKLRDFASRSGMQWVLNEVDEAVSQGVFETRTFRPSSQQGVLDYIEAATSDVRESVPKRTRSRSEVFLSRRPMTDFEQAELLVQALRRILIELDDIAVESIAALNALAIQDQPALSGQAKFENFATAAPPSISGIEFQPDDGSAETAISSRDWPFGQRADTVAAIIDEIEREINS